VADVSVSPRCSVSCHLQPAPNRSSARRSRLVCWRRQTCWLARTPRNEACEIGRPSRQGGTAALRNAQTDTPGESLRVLAPPPSGPAADRWLGVTCGRRGGPAQGALPRFRHLAGFPALGGISMSGVADWPSLPDLAISNHHQLEIAVTFSSEKRPRQISLMLKVLADGYIQYSHAPWRLPSLKKHRRMPPKRTTGGGAGEPGTSDPLTPGGAGPCRPGAPQTLLVLSEMQTCSSMSGEAGGRIKRASALNRPFSGELGPGRIS
jgi:hypothetical protein